MRALLDQREQDELGEDTELTLGVGSLLAIFFGVVLVCGLCFGIGYSMGHRSDAPKSADAQAVASSPYAISGRKPRAVPTPPAEQTIDTQTGAGAASDTNTPAAADSKNPDFPADFKAPEPDESAPAPRQHPAKSAQPGVASARPAVIAPTPVVAYPRNVDSSTSSAPSKSLLMVQIAAVSRQEDAAMLSAALRKRGFNPMVRHGAADSFFHVQVGPFADSATANAMKDRLEAQGYNAILK